jgi:hypothetical protein
MLPCGFRTLRLPTNPCGPSPCTGLSPAPTTMAAPTPVRHLNHSLSSRFHGGRTGLPRSLFDSFHWSLGLSCTPVHRLLAMPSAAAGLHLCSHCRFSSMRKGFFIDLQPSGRLPADFHPISIVCRGVDPLGASGRDSLRNHAPTQACSPGVVMECRPFLRVLRASDRFWLVVPCLPNQPR